nr:IS481 family transposase [Micromonospora sp. DSM 115978]
MSRARLVIVAVVAEGRSQSEVARSYGVSQGWVSRLVARYRAEGEAAFEPRSRRPHSSPTALPEATVDLVVRLRKELSEQGLDAGADTIVWHAAHHHATTVSTATVNRTLTRRGLVVPAPAKRPKSSYVRFEAAMPNETWQADFTHYPLTRPDGRPGPDQEVLTWLDDCSRYALSVTAHSRLTGLAVLETFRRAVAVHGAPASTLTDNGMVFTTRFCGGGGGRNALETELDRLHVAQKNSRPNHPTTCGKVERFQQTMKNWLAVQPTQPTSTDGLQTLLDTFAEVYNHHRPHRSLPQRTTPAGVYTTRPKAAPAPSGDPAARTRVHHCHVDATGTVTLRADGRRHRVGVGRTHARTRVMLLVDGLHVRVVDIATGQLLRDLTVDPTRCYQPTGRPTGPTPKTSKP